MALLGLGVDQLVAHHVVPLLPLVAFPVAHHLGGVVVVVHVALGGALLAEPLDAALQGRVVLLPAQVHPAEQADGRGGLAGARVGVAVVGAAVGLHGVEEREGLLDGDRRARGGRPCGRSSGP